MENRFPQFPPILEGRKRIVVAMSGGVDSSVTAAILAKEGHEVIGITLRLWTPSPWNNGERYGSCCAPSDVADAKKVCQQMGIPHYTFDMEKQFKEKVVDNFVSEYLDGRTPNPCVRCNSFIKFDPLLKYAMALNADYLATGHYARIERSSWDGSGRFSLHKAADSTKDQSYFLYMLNQNHLSRLLFPLGDRTKAQARQIAEEYGLVNAKKHDSQDVCFLEGRTYREFIQEYSGRKMEKGLIQTADGRVIGEHEGLPFYTIGQRGKLGVAAGQRLYVIEKDSHANTLVVGTDEENKQMECELDTVSWCDGEAPMEAVSASVKIRYRHTGGAARIEAFADSRAKVKFSEGQSSITPGQSAVFYEGDRILGGGIIR